MQRLSPYDQYEQREHPEWNLPPGVTPDDIERLYADPSRRRTRRAAGAPTRRVAGCSTARKR